MEPIKTLPFTRSEKYEAISCSWEIMLCGPDGRISEGWEIMLCGPDGRISEGLIYFC